MPGARDEKGRSGEFPRPPAADWTGLPVFMRRASVRPHRWADSAALGRSGTLGYLIAGSRGLSGDPPLPDALQIRHPSCPARPMHMATMHDA